jgi:hypothetical protein
MVGATLGAFVLAGVLATYLHLIRSGIRATQYAEMETQVRRGFEQLGHDLKIASGITWNSASNLTLTVPDSSGATSPVTYAWDSTAQSFFRVPGASSTATAGRIDLVRGIPPLANGSAGLTFTRYDHDGVAATTDLATKRIVISMTISRRAGTLAVATENAVATSFILRNKPTH